MNRYPSFLRLSALAAAAVLAGCSMIPERPQPQAGVPQAYPMAAAAAGTAPSGADLAWSGFVTDARLRDVVQRALTNNRDLRVATLNIEQVRAQYQIQRSNQFPTINLAATGNRQPNASGGITDLYSVGLATSAWEIDFFGRLASLKEAALAQFLASEEARRAAQTSLVATVSSTWLSLQANESLLALTRQTLKTREDSLRLTKLRFDNGAASALDLRQAESLTAAAQVALAQAERARLLDVNALNLLVGEPLPASLLAPATPDAALPLAVLAEVPAGLPSDLLTRRADVRQAERRLAAATASGISIVACSPHLAVSVAAAPS